MTWPPTAVPPEDSGKSSGSGIWHPDRKSLVEFANGEGSDHAFKRIELHLTECESCVDAIASLNSQIETSEFSCDIEEAIFGRRTKSAQGTADLAPQIHRLDQNDESPAKSLGPYQLLRIVGEGGMGVVYQARQIHPVHSGTVALKILKPGLDSRQFVRRFEIERQTLARLQHPDIASVLDAGETEQGQPYLVMEYIDGLPITEFCDENRLTISERLRLFEKVCLAVQHAHQNGVIHRDRSHRTSRHRNCGSPSADDHRLWDRQDDGRIRRQPDIRDAHWDKSWGPLNI